ncbi:hypothetical protein NDU88_001620 [Pleurodeles waltl]|uniref:Uncharacterized protein n=1 Tax=Pleurodeles waltl TaxID=8319 RepID=A0AAV7UAS3_PLEWA|nr:hypothetical protein NDU88_001620 [Pleurodeles waltl]
MLYLKRPLGGALAQEERHRSSNICNRKLPSLSLELSAAMQMLRDLPRPSRRCSLQSLGLSGRDSPMPQHLNIPMSYKITPEVSAVPRMP